MPPAALLTMPAEDTIRVFGIARPSAPLGWMPQQILAPGACVPEVTSFWDDDTGWVRRLRMATWRPVDRAPHNEHAPTIDLDGVFDHEKDRDRTLFVRALVPVTARDTAGRRLAVATTSPSRHRLSDPVPAATFTVITYSSPADQVCTAQPALLPQAGWNLWLNRTLPALPSSAETLRTLFAQV